jgi:hypothetical protein
LFRQIKEEKMNPRQFFTRGILLTLVMLVSSCATPQAALDPTSEPLFCPTSEPLSCPTTAAQAMPEITGWRMGMATDANAFITFDSGDKCTMQKVRPLRDGRGLSLDLVAKDNNYQDYIVWIETLDPGKTLDDLIKLTDPITAPTWAKIIGAVLVTPMSRTFYADAETINAAEGPIYFTCQVEGPVARKFINHLGPLEFEAP